LFSVILAALSGSAVNLTVNNKSDAWSTEPILPALVRWLAPLTVLMAGYMLWIGASLPGGAFQAGALLAGTGVMIVLAGNGFYLPALVFRWLLVIGLTVFVAVAVLTAWHSGILLKLPVAWAASVILLIESAATLSIATTLLALFIAFNNKAATRP
jgi:multisubunit Na+/H+ antiporter MnhB subunit